MFIEDYRASKILFNFLISSNIKGKFILPSNVCAVIPLIFHYANVDFDFVDIQLNNFCIDQNQIKEKIQAYSGVLFVRSYGTTEDFEPFFKTLKIQKQDFIIIDDSCLCVPDVNYEESSNVDLKLFSTGYAKQVDLQIGAFAFVHQNFKYKKIETKYSSNDYDIYEMELSNDILSGRLFKPHEYHFLKNQEYNYDLDQFKSKVSDAMDHKKRLNLIYQNELPSDIQLGDPYQQWRFNILVNENIKKKILKSLFNEHLFASSHYESLSFVWRNQASPNSTTIKKKIINLFNDFYYNEEKAFSTCKIINKNL